uniref:Uncharacterized protein n=1 Tax=Utricularia reniformis TaxID=192314 RepID=A0A1Y0B3A6_9LAMI|nr:hypothetical protein AEK19_MT1750 [Utricularia reniformis]ART31926.1 hypothetical protein AEK19_MT1750 [Utricularia reniformis]
MIHLHKALLSRIQLVDVLLSPLFVCQLINQ